jgi:flagellar motility protein MotE (MotC chaperone)
MKKKILIGGLLGLVSFFLSLWGFYLMMPSLAPDKVVDTKLELDSLGLIHFSAADSIRAARDSVLALADTLEPVPATHFDVPDVATEDSVYRSSIVDSLQLVLSQIRAMEQEKAALMGQVEALTQRIQTIESRRVEAENLSTTLTKLDDRQLGAILQGLDEKVLEMIYQKASAKNQARLLQALPSERAASFIQGLVRSGAAPAPTTPAADPATPDGSSEP